MEKKINIGSSSEEVITIRGARQHNLKNIDLSIPTSFKRGPVWII